MNYYDARQRSDDKRWDYTVANKRTGTYAIGYCTGWDPKTLEYFTEKFGASEAEMFFKDQEERSKFKNKYHDNGHETKEEACACYRSYLLDHHLSFDSYKDEQRKCVICQSWTQKYASVSHEADYPLCEQHLNRESVEKLYHVGYSMSSY